jgi:Holliday junction resolvasome RuvABC ATP-dependent DNA helicase subunit
VNARRWRSPEIQSLPRPIDVTDFQGNEAMRPPARVNLRVARNRRNAILSMLLYCRYRLVTLVFSRF